MGEQKRRKKSFQSYKFKRFKIKLTVSLIVFVIGAVMCMDYAKRSQKPLISIIDPSRTKGDAHAPLQILEFIDFQCAHCKEGSDIIGEYLLKYPQGLSVNVKYFPLGELNSMKSALYAQCAAQQNKFWRFQNELFTNQDQWRPLLQVDPFFHIMAKDSNLDLNQLDQCLEQGKAESIVKQDKLLGDSYGVRITPTYFINDEMIVGVEALRRALEGFFEEQTDVYMMD